MKAWALLGVLAVASCGRTVTEDDCTRIKDNMREAWAEECKQDAPSEGAGTEKAAAVMKAEEERLANDWMTECRKELMGRRAEPKEMNCMLQAKSIAAIGKCGEP